MVSRAVPGPEPRHAGPARHGPFKFFYFLRFYIIYLFLIHKEILNRVVESLLPMYEILSSIPAFGGFLMFFGIFTC